jgi:hypothetical protein
MSRTWTRSQPSGGSGALAKDRPGIGAVLFFILAGAALPTAFSPRDCGPRGCSLSRQPRNQARIAAE